MWFTPKYTTAQMKQITGNKDFVYEISCDQMCGSGHYSMRGVVIVETQEEYDKWLSSLKPQYTVVKESQTAPAPQAASAAKDSLAVKPATAEAKPIAQVIK